MRPDGVLRELRGRILKARRLQGGEVPLELSARLGRRLSTRLDRIGNPGYVEQNDPYVSLFALARAPNSTVSGPCAASARVNSAQESSALSTWATRSRDDRPKATSAFDVLSGPEVLRDLGYTSLRGVEKYPCTF
jgi:hypothetical protein